MWRRASCRSVLNFSTSMNSLAMLFPVPAFPHMLLRITVATIYMYLICKTWCYGCGSLHCCVISAFWGSPGSAPGVPEEAEQEQAAVGPCKDHQGFASRWVSAGPQRDLPSTPQGPESVR